MYENENHVFIQSKILSITYKKQQTFIYKVVNSYIFIWNEHNIFIFALVKRSLFRISLHPNIRSVLLPHDLRNVLI